MAGAAALAGKAALLAGCGLVRLAVPDPVLETVAGFYPELTLLPCPADNKGRFSLEAFDVLILHLESATAAFIGPGLGRSAELDTLVFKILCSAAPPLVVDADALNAVAEYGMERFKGIFRSSLVFTPHSAEFARLRNLPTPTEEQWQERVEAAREFAKEYGVVLVLKGHRTIITDGERLAVNPAGNPGMATGGSGDVLTGVLTGLRAQNVPAFEAAQLGVFLHSVAGDAAAERYTEESVTASTILEMLPYAMKTLKQDDAG